MAIEVSRPLPQLFGACGEESQLQSCAQSITTIGPAPSNQQRASGPKRSAHAHMRFAGQIGRWPSWQRVVEKLLPAEIGHMGRECHELEGGVEKQDARIRGVRVGSVHHQHHQPGLYGGEHVLAHLGRRDWKR